MSTEQFLNRKCNNCFIEIFGDENSGKEKILISLALEKASRGEVVLYIDSRGSFRPEKIVETQKIRIETMGRIDVLRATEPGFLFEKISRVISNKKYRTILWDGMSLPFYEIQVSYELSFLARLFSFYAIKGNMITVTNPIVSLKGKPFGYKYTDPYVHTRVRAQILKENEGRLTSYGWSAKYFIDGWQVYFQDLVSDNVIQNN